MKKRRAQKLIEKYWLKPCVELLQGENAEPETDDLRLTKLMCDQLEKGKPDIVAVLKKIARRHSQAN